MANHRKSTVIALVFCSLLLGIPGANGQGLKVSQLAFPGARSTYASSVNSKNQVVGSYVTSAGTATVGFHWLGGSTYKAIVFPGSKAFTRANGINDSGEIVGDFLSKADGFYHGFTDVNGTLTQYDVPGGLGHLSTSLFGISNIGNLAGSAGTQGFVSIGGVVTLFNASGTDTTYAYAINDSGEAVGQYFDGTGLSHGYMWKAGVVTEIAYPGATQTACLGINNAGEITGYYIDSAGVSHGFTLISGAYRTSDLPSAGGVNTNGAYVGVYTGPDGVTYGFLGSPTAFKPATVRVPTAMSTSVLGVNSTGVMSGQYTDSKGAVHGMILNGTTVTNVDNPKAAPGTTFCNGINTSLVCAGYYTNATTNQLSGFLYSGGVFTDIPGPAGAIASVVFDISDAGQITGYFVDAAGVQHGFVLSGVGGTYTQLDVPGGTNTYAWGINASGHIAVGFVDAKGNSEGALYNGATYTPMNLAGVQSCFIHALDTAGDAVYSWVDANGNYHGGAVIGGVSYLLDAPGQAGTRADGINDSGLIVGRAYQKGSTTNFNGFSGTK